jgi:hypothetical protein
MGIFSQGGTPMNDDDQGNFDLLAALLPPPPAPSPSRVKRRLIESAVAIDADDPESVVYQHTVLCQTCLPYRDPGPGVRRWQRSQGSARLEIEAGRALDPVSEQFVDVGLPFGPKPRLILAYLNTEAIRRQTPLIEVGDSLTDFVKRIRYFDGGREIRVFRRPRARWSGRSATSARTSSSAGRSATSTT